MLAWLLMSPDERRHTHEQQLREIAQEDLGVRGPVREFASSEGQLTPITDAEAQEWAAEIEPEPDSARIASPSTRP